MSRLHPNRTAGQAVVEMALILPLLATMLLGLADFGFLLYAHVQVTNAAREGARAGSLFVGGRYQYSQTNCWTPDTWVQDALLQRRDANGCPTTTTPAAPVVQAFGLLNWAQCPSATSGTDCWWSVVTWTQDPNDSTRPQPGSQFTVEVKYRYSTLFIGNLIPTFQNPMVIDKTVYMKVQSN